MRVATGAGSSGRSHFCAGPNARPGNGDGALHDRTGRPGPATWELGDYRRGPGRPSGHRGELVRGGGLRRVRRQGAPHGVPVDPRRRDRTSTRRSFRPATSGTVEPRRSGRWAPSAPTAPTTWRATPRSGAGTRSTMGDGSSSGAGGTSRRTCSTTPTRRTRFTRGPGLRAPAGEAPRRQDGAGRLRGHLHRPPRLRQGEAGEARGRPGLQAPLRLRQAPARRAH